MAQSTQSHFRTSRTHKRIDMSFVSQYCNGITYHVSQANSGTAPGLLLQYCS